MYKYVSLSQNDIRIDKIKSVEDDLISDTQSASSLNLLYRRRKKCTLIDRTLLDSRTCPSSGEICGTDFSSSDVDLEMIQVEENEELGFDHYMSTKHLERKLLRKHFLTKEDFVQTFLVLASRLGKVYVYRFNKAKSLCIFGPTNPIRKFIIYLITNQIFEFFVILTILTNCVFLALDDAPEEAEYVFTAIYTSEMMLKIIAKGFALHSFAYLRDPWNWLDFIVVTLGYVTLAPGIVYNFSGIRTFRVLRALRTISAIEGLKTMVNALLKSMRMLSDVLLLTTFFLCVFALVGLQLFSGHLHNRCVSTNITLQQNETRDQAIRNSSNWFTKIPICGNNSGALHCPANYCCLPDIGENPNFGFTSYDDFGWALLTSFQLVTLDFWENVYFQIASALGPWYVLYFFIVIFFGSFYLINLVLAVVAVSYQQETAYNADLESQYEFLREVASSYSLHRRILPKVLFDDPTVDNISNLPCVKKGPSVIIISGSSKSDSTKQSNTIALGRVFHPEIKPKENKEGKAKSHTIVNKKITNIINRVTLDRTKDKLRHDNNNNANNTSTSPERKLNVANAKCVGKTLHLPTVVKDSPVIENDQASKRPEFKTRDSTLSTDSNKSKLTLRERVSNKLAADSRSQFPMPYPSIPYKNLKRVRKVRRNIYNLVTNPWFELSVTVFIMINTICLALEYHGMDEDFKKALDICNHVLTGIFIFEMVLKLVAFTLRGYIASKWNVFDGLVVILSIIDLFVEIFVTAESNGDFTIIRSLRLFRVLKLAQSWSTMRLLLSAIGRSLTALGNLTLILGIIVYMFAVVGTKVFGSEYKKEKFPHDEIPVWNFVNFGHSIMIIFRVLCGEWIEPLYEVMRVSSVWAIAFFLPALVVGNFLVLNLFLALLLNSFADQAMEEELKKKNFIKSKLKWVSTTRKLAKIQNAFKGTSKITPGKETSLKSLVSTLQRKEKERKQSEMSDEFSTKRFSSSDKSSEQISEIIENKNSEILTQNLDKSEKTMEKETDIKNLENESKKTRWLGAIAMANHKETLSNPSDNMENTSSTVIRNSTSTSQLSNSLPFQRNKQNKVSVTSTSSKTFHKLDPFCTNLSCCFSESPEEKEMFLECCNCCVHSRFRMKVKNFIENKWFENGILLLIVASSGILVFEDIHLSEKPTLMKTLDILNVIFCFIFFIEFLLKLIGLGICGYFRNPWNCLDFLIVTVSMVNVVNGFVSSSSNLKTLVSIRTLRALRPLRAVSRWDGMRIVVNSLLKAIPSIGNVLLVCLMFWLIFSILGVQFFGGKFWKCIDENGERLDASIIPNKTACLQNSRYKWRNSYVNFDNALNGFLPLLQVATFEGWIEVMRDAVDATDIDQQPIKDNNFAAYFYFVVFIIVGSFFILNLFISVIIDNFYRLKKQYDDCGTIEVFLTHEQKQWFSTVKKALTKKPKRIIHRPKNYYQGRLFDVILSAKFETVTMILIFVNIVIMMTQHYKQNDGITYMLRIVNLIFTIILTIELIMRVIALRYQYFLDRWNVFDFLIVLFSLVGIVLEYLNVVLHVTPSVLRVARVLRIGRLLRYFNGAKGIRRLLVALVISLPALVNIGALLFLVLFIYSIIGMSNFGYVKKQGAINEINNFETFGNSMLLLFRLATSAGWNEVLDSLMIQSPDCDPTYKNAPNGNCGTKWIAVIYFVTYILITYLIIVNMYIAVILENFNQAHEQEEIGITDEDIEMFYAVWQLYDPLATQYIEFEKLPYFVANLGPPLGIPFPNKVAVHNLNLPMKEDDKIHCIDVLQALLKRVLGNVDSTDTEHYDNMTKTIDKKLQDAFPIRLKDTTKTTTMERLKQVKAASTIQRHFRSWKQKAEERRERNMLDLDTFVATHSIENVFQAYLTPETSKRSRKIPIKRLLSDSKLSRHFQSNTNVVGTKDYPNITIDDEKPTHKPVQRSQSAQSPRLLSTSFSKNRVHSTPVRVRTASPQRKFIKNAICTNRPLSSASMYSLQLTPYNKRKSSATSKSSKDLLVDSKEKEHNIEINISLANIGDNANISVNNVGDNANISLNNVGDNANISLANYSKNSNISVANVTMNANRTLINIKTANTTSSDNG